MPIINVLEHTLLHFACIQQRKFMNQRVAHHGELRHIGRADGFLRLRLDEQWVDRFAILMYTEVKVRAGG